MGHIRLQYPMIVITGYTDPITGEYLQKAVETINFEYPIGYLDKTNSVNTIPPTGVPPYRGQPLPTWVVPRTAILAPKITTANGWEAVPGSGTLYEDGWTLAGSGTSLIDPTLYPTGWNLFNGDNTFITGTPSDPWIMQIPAETGTAFLDRALTPGTLKVVVALDGYLQGPTLYFKDTSNNNLWVAWNLPDGVSEFVWPGMSGIDLYNAHTTINVYGYPRITELSIY